MKKVVNFIAVAIVSLCLLPQNVLAAQLLIPVGKVVGLELRSDSVTVAAFDDSIDSAARAGGLRIGDEILSIDGQAIDSAEDVRSALNSCGDDVEILVSRDGKKHRLTLIPQDSGDGKRLGVYLRQGIAGIGTVTYYDPETHAFGTLGHGVSDAKGNLVQMTLGNLYTGQVLSVKKGTSGQPGQLRGSADPAEAIGTIAKNTPQGVFGISKEGWLGEPLPVAAYGDIAIGPATIRSTVIGDMVQEYSVEIMKIYPEDRSDNRNFLIRITDPTLLDTTGGIVQGMSGSPIIQNGKFVGAVTHVLVNDPQTGYGIFIENMLDAAG